jgi:hypothetical protein
VAGLASRGLIFVGPAHKIVRKQQPGAMGVRSVARRGSKPPEEPMPSTEQGERSTPVESRRAFVRWLSACRQTWHEAFPDLHRRAQQQIVTHLGIRGRAGAAVGELHGLVKQIFLLDDSTVKERILQIARGGLCRLDPGQEALSTRTLVVPTPALLERFDAYLHTLGERLLAVASCIDPALRGETLSSGLAAPQRGLMLRALEHCAEAWRGALERFFDAQSLSPARRVEALRHLNATSHGALVQMAIEHRYGISALAGGEEGLLADRMAAALLDLIGQNFQTTRDHILYLIELGLLARQPGKALRVRLAEAAAPHFDAALSAGAAALPSLARALVGRAPAAPADAPSLMPVPPVGAEEPDQLRTARRRGGVPRLVHELLVVMPGVPPRRVPIIRTPLTIGRLPPCDLLLPGADVSRQHCRVDLAEQQLCITDLNSTNGTLVEGQRIMQPAVLRPGTTVQIGSCLLTYECRPEASERPADEAESTERTARRPVIVNKAGNPAV